MKTSKGITKRKNKQTQISMSHEYRCKILNKILADVSNNLLKKRIIQNVQVGFISGTFDDSTIRKLIQHSTTSKAKKEKII